MPSICESGHWYHYAFINEAFAKRDFEAVVAEAYKVGMPDFYWPHVWLAIGYAELGEMDKANAAADRVRELYPKWPIEAKSQFELNWNSGPLPLIRNIDRLHRLAEF